MSYGMIGFTGCSVSYRTNGPTGRLVSYRTNGPTGRFVSYETSGPTGCFYKQVQVFWIKSNEFGREFQWTECVGREFQ